MEITPIRLSNIQRGSQVVNDRQQFDPQGIEELAISIARDGLAQPITVREVDDHYEIVAGERRYRAHCYLRDHGCTYQKDGQTVTVKPGETTTIQALIKDLSDEEASAIMLAENTGRQDLNPIEEALAYQHRLKTFKKSEQEVANVAGVSVDRVKRRLSLLSLIEEIQHLLRFGHIPIGHAEAMTLLDADRQRIAYRVFSEAKNGLPLRQFKHIVNDLLAQQSQTSLFDLENFWVEQVQKDTMPRRGKRAYVPAPTSKDLPPVKRNTKWSSSDVIDQYIADLIASGHEAEAAALGNVYHTLVRHNYMAVPVHSAIPEPDEEQETHEQRGIDYRGTSR